MLATVLTEVKGLVDGRFMLNAFFPVLVTALAAGALVASTQGGVAAALTRWDGYSGTVQLALLVSFVATVFVLATFLANSMTALVRLYEGYLLPAWLRDTGSARQAKRRARAHLDPGLLFPREARLRATALGNVIGAAEDYPFTAYGIDSVVVWPRLFPLLPERFLASMAAPLQTLQFLLATSFLSGMFAVGGGVYVAVYALGRPLFAVVVLGGATLSVLAYRSATETAVEYGLHLRAAFDLYRNDALRQLRRPLPSSTDEESRLWNAVSISLATGEQQLPLYPGEPGERER
jgi:hypothetical protein